MKLHVDSAVHASSATTVTKTSATPLAPSRINRSRSGMPERRATSSQSSVGNDANTRSTPVYRPGRWDIWILGISIGLGGQYFSWNDGLRGGLYTFLIDYFLVGFAYITLCCCASEITGALPFAGGAYGLSRCTLGLYPGFIIGCAETIEYIIYVATSVLALADMLVESIPELGGFEPLIWLLFYASALYFHIRGDYIFWRWNMAIGVLSLFFVLLYCIGSFPHTNFAVNADNDPDFRFVHGGNGFMRSLPLSCWFFVGVEALNLASDDVVDPKISIPFAQVSCILALFLSGIVVFFVTVSLPPPGLKQISKLLAPFDNGYQLLFDISVKTATLFSIPAMYATTFGFMWGYGKLIAAMATSKLLPPILAHPHPKYGTPYLAVLFGSSLSYFMCLLVFYVPSIVDKYLFNICIAMAFIGYASQCVGYIALKRNYPNIKSSSFHSPFGNYGAIYSLVIWLLGLTSIAGFQENGGIEILVFSCTIAALTLFYFAYAQSRQTLSSQENKVFLMAHVMKLSKTNSRKKQYSSQTVQRQGGGSPTRLIGATGLVRPTLQLPQLGGRDGSNHQTNRPLKLPVVKPIPGATPFHRQFTSPRVEDPYGDTDPYVFPDPNEIQAARFTTAEPLSDATASAPAISAILFATDGIFPSESAMKRRASEPFMRIDEMVEREIPESVSVSETPEERASNDVDERSEVYNDGGRKCGGESEFDAVGVDEGRATWFPLSSRFAAFVLTNVGIVNELDPADSGAADASKAVASEPAQATTHEDGEAAKSTESEDAHDGSHVNS